MSARTVAVLALSLAALAGCRLASIEARRGERSYDAGRYPESYQHYRNATDVADDPALEFNAGNALYRMKRYDIAAKSYRVALAGPARLEQRSYFNLGNAALRSAEDAKEKDELFRQAIVAYQEALRLDPSDLDAKWNLELALKRRAEHELGSSSGHGRHGDYGQGNHNAPGYEGNPQAAVGAMAGGGYGSGEGESAEELNESQARQLLDAVQREQLSSHEGRRSSRPSVGGKDW